MILQALNEYYQILLNDPESGVAPPGFSSSKVSHAILISKVGELLEVVSMLVEDGNFKLMNLPEKVQRSSNVNPNFLYDNASYVLGITKEKEGKEFEVVVSKDKFEAFKKNHNDVLVELHQNVEIEAFLNFVNKWNPIDWEKYLGGYEKAKELINGKNIVFKVEGIKGFLHENKLLVGIFNKNNTSNNKSTDNFSAQCLITGEVGKISRTHTVIQGVRGAQTSGAAIVSFNNESFKSYKKDQSYNAPVSENATFAYTTALNYLLNSRINNVSFADTTIVFWAQRECTEKKEEMILAWSLEPFDPDKEEANSDKKELKVDKSTARQAKETLESVRNGLPIKSKDIDKETKCYLLGLAPNAARISIRFFKVDTFGNFIEKIALHYNDMNIVGIAKYGNYLPPSRILREVTTRNKKKGTGEKKKEKIPPLFGGQLMNSILSGTLYPYSLYVAAISVVQHFKIGIKSKLKFS